MNNLPIFERLKFDNRKDYLYAELDCAALTASEALDAMSEIMAEAARVRCKKIMVKCNVASFESDTALLQSMLELATMRSGSKIAFVECQNSKHEHPSISDEFKLFDESSDAAAWLTAD